MKQTARDGHRIRRSCLLILCQDCQTDRGSLVRIHEQEQGQKDRRSQRTDRAETEGKSWSRTGEKEQETDSPKGIEEDRQEGQQQDRSNRSRDRTVCRSSTLAAGNREKTSDFILSKGIIYCHI